MERSSRNRSTEILYIEISDFDPKNISDKRFKRGGNRVLGEKSILKLIQESYIVLVEQPHIIDLVFQERDTLKAKAEGES